MLQPIITEETKKELLKSGNYRNDDMLGKPLSKQEFKVLSLLMNGLSRNEIAQQLDKSPNTVRNQIVSIMDKFNCDSTDQLIIAIYSQYLAKHGLAFDLNKLVQ